jgi:hypothetical protein
MSDAPVPPNPTRVEVEEPAAWQARVKYSFGWGQWQNITKEQFDEFTARPGKREIGNGWVKRSERLPTVGGTYLVGAYDDTTPLPRTFVRFWASFFLFDAGPEWQILDAEHEHRTVEYWIDLPPHPEHPGRKPAVRADRDDIIEMCARTEPTKYDLVPGRYQKRTLIKRISYVLTGGQFGIEPGYVVLGLSDPEVTP